MLVIRSLLCPKFTFILLYTTLNLKACKIIIDHFEIADRFCKYFTNIGPHLASKIPQANSSFHTFLTNDINKNSPITLDQTNVDELHEICHSFQSGKAPGLLISQCT